MTHSILVFMAMLLLPTATPATQPDRTPALEPPPDIVAADSVMVGFVQAVNHAEWQKALGYCSPEVQNQAKQYASPEAFFRAVFPLEQIAKQTRDHYYWKPHPNSSKGGSWQMYTSLIFKVAELDKDPWLPAMYTDMRWRVTLDKTDSGGVIDFPTVTLQEYIATGLAKLKRAREQLLATEKELEPKLRGVHTRLTALQERFEAGQPVRFRLELINEGSAQLLVDKSQVGVGDWVIVKDEHGNPVPFGNGPVQTAWNTEPIASGQTIVLVNNWDLGRPFKLTKPGRYTVQYGGGLPVSEADPHKIVHAHQFPSNTLETQPAEDRYSMCRFPSNIVPIEVIASQPTSLPGG